MPAGSLLALFDDISAVLDDVAVLAKVAARKTAGVVGDDLALNAQQVAGVSAERELPVVWAVARGSFVNKAILVPAALLVSAVAPWAVGPLLMIGGLYLCYEGAEKLAHRLLAPTAADEAHRAELSQALADPTRDLVLVEKDRIRGAIRTDFILSAEIVAITLGTVAQSSLPVRVGVLTGMALVMTAGVYGLVAGIVKLDDVGLWLSRRGDGPRAALGRAILAVAPWLMKALSAVGTAAMFLVGGGIAVHGVGPLHHAVEAMAARAGGVAGVALPIVADAVIGLLAGAVVLGAVSLARRVRRGPPRR